VRVLRDGAALLRVEIRRRVPGATAPLSKTARKSKLAFECDPAVLNRRGSLLALKSALARDGYRFGNPEDEECETVLIHESAVGASGLHGLPAGARQVIHLVDEMSAAAAADADHRGRFLAIQQASSATLLTSDYCLQDLAMAGLSPSDPWVVKAPPDSTLFFRKGETGARGDSPVRLLALAHRAPPEHLGLLAGMAGDPAYRVTAVSDRAMPGFDFPVSVNPDVTERSRLARESDIVVALPPLAESHLLLECLACGLPVLLHKELKRFEPAVGMAGLPFADSDSLRDALLSVGDDYEAFSTAAAVPHADEGMEGFLRLTTGP
jgi:hypothetical protein